MDSNAFFSMSLDTLKVPMKLHQENREKLVAALRKKGFESGVVVLQGGEQEHRHDTDVEIVFRQESFFHYLFGVIEPGFFGAICFDGTSHQSVLFCPRLHPLYEVWQGEIKPITFFTEKYAVNETKYVETLGDFISAFAAQNSTAKIFVLEGVNSDSGSKSKPATFDALSGFEQQGKVDRNSLHPVISECRVTKSKLELEVLRYVSAVSSRAHVTVMQTARPGMTEYQLEASFLHHVYYHGGCRMTAYTCICGCGPSGAVLHYGHAAAPNDRVIQNGEMGLLDMGAEYHCYASDITCSYPINGTFSDNQRAVYNAVLDAQRAVMEKLKPGVSWVDMHRVASKTILSHLITMGVLKGNLDEMVRSGLGAIFMPHGLGHLLGKDVHDVGGYLAGQPTRPDDDGTQYGICKIRTARILEENMVLTVEPGLYFIKGLMNKLTESPNLAEFVNAERLREFENFGGVRIEDVVCITQDGFVNFTLCPRTVEEIEGVMARKMEWPPKVDAAPWLKRLWETPTASAN